MPKELDRSKWGFYHKYNGQLFLFVDNKKVISKKYKSPSHRTAIFKQMQEIPTPAGSSSYILLKPSYI